MTLRFTSSPSENTHNVPWRCTLSEGVDGVTGRQVGTSDKVLTARRFDFYAGPALQVTLETAYFTRREGNVGDTSLAVVPVRIYTKMIMH